MFELLLCIALAGNPDLELWSAFVGRGAMVFGGLVLTMPSCLCLLHARLTMSRNESIK